MKKAKLNNFLKNVTSANAIVSFRNMEYELINFNNQVTPGKYRLFLEEKSQEAFFIHLENIKAIQGESKIYKNFIQQQFRDALSEFFDNNGYLNHKRLTITDVSDHQLRYDEMPKFVKEQISLFLSVQKACLHCFELKLFDDGNSPHSFDLDWLGSKTDFIIMTTALYLGGFIGSKNGSNSKKEVIQKLSRYFNIDVSNYKILLNKAVTRENSATIIDKLKSILSDYSDDLLN